MLLERAEVGQRELALVFDRAQFSHFGHAVLAKGAQQGHALSELVVLVAELGLHESDSFDELSEGGVALGFIDDFEFEAAGPVSLEEDDLLLLYTDGIIEAMNPDNEPFGKERLSRMLRENRAASARDLFHLGLLHHLRRFDSQADRSAAKGLKDLLKDNDIWTLYKPQTEEIETLQSVFGKLGGGSKSAFREALRLLREFDEK